MTLINLLTIDKDTANETKNSLIRALHSSATAAQDYAEAALEASMACYRAAETGRPLAEAFTAYTRVHSLIASAQRMLSTVSELSTIVCAVQESHDEEANESYADHLIAISKTDKVSAMIEAAHRRMVIVNASLPSIIAPAARFNTAVFAPEE